MAVRTKPETTSAQSSILVNGNGPRAVTPPAGPFLRKRERARRGLIAAGVVLVLSCGLGAGLLFEHQGGKVSVIKVAKAVPAGHTIEADDLTTAQMASDDIPAFAGSHMSEVVGKTAVVGLVPGEILNKAMVTTRPATPAGYVVAGVSLRDLMIRCRTHGERERVDGNPVARQVALRAFRSAHDPVWGCDLEIDLTGTAGGSRCGTAGRERLT